MPRLVTNGVDLEREIEDRTDRDPQVVNNQIREGRSLEQANGIGMVTMDYGGDEAKELRPFPRRSALQQSDL